MATKAVILCGGLGTRLREETEFKPKPMVLIGGMPVLWHIMKIYSYYGVKDFVLCLGYRGDLIKSYFLNHEIMSQDVTISLKGNKTVIHDQFRTDDWNITLAETGANTMTGARIKRIEKYIEEDEFLLTYGDGVSDINISKLIEHHRRSNVVGTLTGVHPISRFGMVKADDEGTVKEFVEKPILYDDYVNGGFFMFKKELFDHLEDDESCTLETRPLSALAEKRQLAMYKHTGFWHCMDTYRDYLDLNKVWDSGKAPWKVW